MKRRASFLLLLLFLLLGLLGGSGGLGAQTPAEAADDGAGWSVGTSLTYPIVRIYPLHINRRIDAQREVFFGPAYQNWTSGTITAQSYTLLLGYRHYLWRELHVELELWPAWGRWHSSVTDQSYPGW